jgi:hypothetical protein
MKLIKVLQESADFKEYITLLESADDFDDEDPDVKIANADKKQAEFEKKTRVKRFNADAMVGAKKAKTVVDDEDFDAQPTPRKKAVKSTATDSPAGDNAGTGAKSARGEKAVVGRKYMQDNPQASRGMFTKFMAQHGAGAAYSSTLYYLLRNKLNEVFYITNDEGQVLVEGDKWSSFSNCKKRPLMFKSEWNAKGRTLRTGGNVVKSSLTEGIMDNVKSIGKRVMDKASDLEDKIRGNFRSDKGTRIKEGRMPAVRLDVSNIGDVEIEGIDPNDYPDFCDAYVSYAVWIDTGIPLDDETLEYLTTNYGEFVYDHIVKKLY